MSFAEIAFANVSRTIGVPSAHPARRRQLVDEVPAMWKVSIRRTCAVLRAERSSYHYKGRRRSQAALTKRIKE